MSYTKRRFLHLFSLIMQSSSYTSSKYVTLGLELQSCSTKLSHQEITGKKYCYGNKLLRSYSKGLSSPLFNLLSLLVVRQQCTHWLSGVSSRKGSVGCTGFPSPQWALVTFLGTGLGRQGGGPGIRQGLGSWRLILPWFQWGRGWQLWGWPGGLVLAGSGEPPGGQEQAGLEEPQCCGK